MRPIAARYDRAANRGATPASVTMNDVGPKECCRQTKATTRSVALGRLSAAGSPAGSEVT